MLNINLRHQKCQEMVGTLEGFRYVSSSVPKCSLFSHTPLMLSKQDSPWKPLQFYLYVQLLAWLQSIYTARRLASPV